MSTVTHEIIGQSASVREDDLRGRRSGGLRDAAWGGGFFSFLFFSFLFFSFLFFSFLFFSFLFFLSFISFFEWVLHLCHDI